MEHIDDVSYSSWNVTKNSRGLQWNDILQNFKFEKTEVPSKWRLLTNDVQKETEDESTTATGVTEEAIFTLTGFIYRKELPPFIFKGWVNLRYGGYLRLKPNPRRNLTSAKHRIQHIVLTGFGSKRFDDGVQKLQQLDDIFVCEVGDKDFIGIKVGTAEGHTTLEIMNWLFTSLDVAPGSTHIPFSKQEDPHGDMEGARGSDLIRAEDNVVDYFVKDTKLASSSAERSVHMRECTHWPKQRKQRIQQCNASQAYYIPSRRYGWGWIFGRSFTGQTQVIPAQTRYSIHTTGGYITHPGQCQHNHQWAELTIKQNAIDKKRAAAPDTVKYKRRVNFEIVNETVKRQRTKDHSIS